MMTALHSVGKLLVAALLHPEATHKRALIVNSFTTTPADVLAEFEKQTGTKWEVSYTPLEKLKELEKDAWEKNHPAAAVFTLRRIWSEGGTLYEKTDNEVLGSPKTETLEQQVKQAIAAQS